MKEPFIVRVAPDRKLENWKVVRAGRSQPWAKGVSKNKALKIATRLVEKDSRPAIVMIHKTRYIVEKALQFSH